MYQAALFDLDGVIFDTEALYTEFWKTECKRFCPEMPGLELKIKGQTLVAIYENYFMHLTDEQRNGITARLYAYEHQMTYSYVKGFLPFLHSVRASGSKTAVVTSSNRDKMESIHAQHPELVSLFDLMLTSENYQQGKPSPECYIKASQLIGIQRNECIVFEDSFNGLRAGRDALMTVVGLATSNPPESLLPLADKVFCDFQGQSWAKLIDSLVR